ncbi:hypothetical protein ILUMI_24281 [Ignelater luminosus]|uniref:Uncharacterized protein n=1 Tax=Ignelater luminosus TaxID=2038154 RepID=A0A8K0C6K0_IGNLU|nr:hypothetical protein ILUMI_24281 [Ignelater luminosus]
MGTDNSSLIRLQQMMEKNSKLMQWSFELQRYSNTVWRGTTSSPTCCHETLAMTVPPPTTTTSIASGARFCFAATVELHNCQIPDDQYSRSHYHSVFTQLAIHTLTRLHEQPQPGSRRNSTKYPTGLPLSRCRSGDTGLCQKLPSVRLSQASLPRASVA